jgi:hypothetical protein
MPKHRHVIPYSANTNAGYKSVIRSNGTEAEGFSPYQGEDQPHNNIQPSLVVNYIIKASGTAILTGNVVDSLEGNSITNAPSQRAVNEAINSWRNRQNRFDCILTAKKPTTNQWSAIAENYTTPIIPAGRYLIAFRTTMLGAGGGVSTINPCLDGTRLHATLRTTIPIVNGLRSSAQSDVYRDFTEETTHTVNIDAYSNVGVTPENVEVWFIRLD